MSLDSKREAEIPSEFLSGGLFNLAMEFASELTKEIAR